MSKKIQCPNCSEYRMMDRRRALLLSSGALCVPLLIVWVFVALVTGLSVEIAAYGMFLLTACGLALMWSGAKENPQATLTCMNCGFTREKTA